MSDTKRIHTHYNDTRLSMKCTILRFLYYREICHGIIIYRPDIFIWMYVMRIRHARKGAEIREGTLRVTGEKSEIQKLSAAENFPKSRETLELLKVQEPLIPGDLISRESRPAHAERFLNHKLNLTSRAKSLAIYMAADNEIYRRTAVGNFWRVSPAFCRASAKVCRPNGYFYKDECS